MSGNWYSTYAHIADGNNAIYGHANYIRVKAYVGVQPGALAGSGGANI